MPGAAGSAAGGHPHAAHDDDADVGRDLFSHGLGIPHHREGHLYDAIRSWHQPRRRTGPDDPNVVPQIPSVVNGHCQSSVFADTGHVPMIEQPDRFNAAVEAFTAPTT